MILKFGGVGPQWHEGRRLTTHHRTKKRHDTKKMKKLYTQPTIEQENLWVEAGIAMSLTDDYLLYDEGVSAGYLEENLW